MHFWQGKRVFLTGHTGFKGVWLAIWLQHLGAKVAGYALPPESSPNLYTFLDIAGRCEKNILADIADLALLQQSIRNFAPDIVIHMAAQALVRRSYREPLATVATNVTGTAHVLEACRDVESIKAALIVTTDKCYKNNETGQAYHEHDELGGHDMYSASKACAEIITHAYRRSFFNSDNIRICTARAGNVIGAGDWSEDRLIPDAVRAFSAHKTLDIRSSNARRPWQHVVEPLSGYLILARAMFENKKPLSGSYNFGPNKTSVVPVKEVIDLVAKYWQPTGVWRQHTPKEMLHEAELLMLDASLAHKELGWHPIFTLEETLAHTAEGYRDFYNGITPDAFIRNMLSLCEKAHLQG